LPDNKKKEKKKKGNVSLESGAHLTPVFFFDYNYFVFCRFASGIERFNPVDNAQHLISWMERGK